jgi:hypothetical protein
MERQSKGGNMNKCITLIASFFLLLAPLMSFGQAAGDTAPFSSVESHGFDSINLQNLTVYLNIGIRDKAAGPIPFSYSLIGNSHCGGAAAAPHDIYCGIATAVPYGNVPESNLSWVPTIEVPGFLSAQATEIHTAECSKGLTTLYGLWVVYGEGGTAHPLPNTDEVDTLGCYSTGFTDVAVDDSGLGISVTNTAITTPTVFSKHGNSTTYPWTSVEDTNGNSMSVSPSECTTCTFTDTLGATVLTATSIYGYPQGTYTWTDVNGNDQTVAAISTAATLKTGFGCASYPDSDSSAYLLTQINYPDTSSVKLGYEATPGGGGYTGRIASIQLRTGGTISYQYLGGNNGINCTYFVPNSMTRTTQDGTTTYTWASTNSGLGNTTTVVDPGGNQTVYTFTEMVEASGGNLGSLALSQVQTYQNNGTVAKPSNVLLTTDVICYNGNTSLSTCPTATVSQTITEKDVYHTINGMLTSSRVQTLYDKYGNVTSVARYDFGATSYTFQTTTQYGTWNGSACVAIGSYVYDRPCDVKTTDGTNTLAESRYTYDAHGNLLTKSQWTGTAWLTSSYTYNSNGTVATFTDVNQTQATQWSYIYASASGGCNGLLLTQSQITVSSGDTLTTNQTWNCNGGVLVSGTDANGKSTNVGYANSSGTPEPFWRVSSLEDPTGYTTYTNYAPTTINNNASFGSSVQNTTTYLDGLGRPILAQKQEGPGSTNYDTVSTSYTWNGTAFQTGKSTACVETLDAGCTSNFANSTVDPLRRPIATQDPEGGAATHTYSQNDVDITLGPAPTGEDLKSTQTEYDGLGRVKSVCQILVSGGTSCGQNTAASGYLTTYTYGTFAGGHE